MWVGAAGALLDYPNKALSVYVYTYVCVFLVIYASMYVYACIIYVYTFIIASP